MLDWRQMIPKHPLSLTAGVISGVIVEGWLSRRLTHPFAAQSYVFYALIGLAAGICTAAVTICWNCWNRRTR